MPTWEEVQQFVKSEADEFTAGLRRAAGGNPTEATFRDKLMPIIADFCKKARIEFAPRGGYSLASGGKPDTAGISTGTACTIGETARRLMLRAVFAAEGM